MKKSYHSHCVRRESIQPASLLLVALWGLVAGTLHAQLFQSDDFNDGDDDGWSRYNVLAPLGLNATFTFPNGAYRIQTIYKSGSQQNPGRAGSIRPELYSNFYVSVDVVDWNDALAQSFGLLARINTPGLLSTTGYAFTWNRGNPVDPIAGDLIISRINQEAPSVTAITSFRFEPGLSYRMVFIGRGPTLEGRVYSQTNTAVPLAVIWSSEDSAVFYPNGQNGLVSYDTGGGQSQTDVTFDNFYATDIEPPHLKVTSLFFGDYELSWTAEASSYFLERSSSLADPNWHGVAAIEILLIGDRFVHYINPQLDGAMSRYYRLIRQ